LLALSVLLVRGCAENGPTPRADVDARALLAKIGQTYGIQIVATEPAFPVQCTYGTIAGHAAAAGEIERYVELFCGEFTLYPRALIERSRLQRIVLCKDLAFAGQLRAAIPDFEHDTLYLDVVRGRSEPLYSCKVIHHEFFHMIDYRDDGLLYEDKKWATLNPANFKYGTGGKNAQLVSSARVLTNKFPGFLNYYSTTGVEEDKAELFANLIVDAAYVEERARTDRVLAAKVLAMKELAARFCPALDESFWAKTRKTSRTGEAF
jgi:hypothetical protein